MEITSKPLHTKLIYKLGCFIEKRKYEILLISFLLLIFGNTVTTRMRIISVTDIYQNFIVGLIVFYNKKWLRAFISCIILVTITLDVFDKWFSFLDLRSWHGFLYLAFFFAIAIEVFNKVFYTKKVSREMLSAALCGFVLLCLIGTFLFYQIDVKFPNSFSNTGSRTEVLSNLNYFSFSTLLTIGYGDITPVTIIAKRAVMFMGLAGHFYTVFITSIIIGKYVSFNKNTGNTSN